jgi:hypothetical protein
MAVAEVSEADAVLLTDLTTSPGVNVESTLLAVWGRKILGRSPVRNAISVAIDAAAPIATTIGLLLRLGGWSGI